MPKKILDGDGGRYLCVITFERQIGADRQRPEVFFVYIRYTIIITTLLK